jgi:aromatic-L-amino-acid decarboxylase
MKPSETLCFDSKTRNELWHHVLDTIETYITRVQRARVTPPSDPEAIRSLLSPMKFDRPMDPIEAVDFVRQGLWNHQVHVAHPRYFGLFNPAPTTMGIAADALVAAFNPQLATWNHNPFACEVEDHLIKTMATQFGYDPEKAVSLLKPSPGKSYRPAMPGFP